MERQHRIGILGQRWGAPRWEDNTARRRDGQCWCIGHETESTFDGSLLVGGADRGDRNKSFGKISDRD